VLEERYEAGGSCETTEPISGVRIYPHAQLMYAAPAPGFEQLELHKYGFRMSWSPIDLENSMGKIGQCSSEGMVPATEVDMIGFAKMSGLLADPPFMKDLLRATFWCPPHPPEVEATDETVPYMQVYKQLPLQPGHLRCGVRHGQRPGRGPRRGDVVDGVRSCNRRPCQGHATIETTIP